MKSTFSYVFYGLVGLCAWSQAFPFRNTHTLRHGANHLKHIRDALQLPKQWKRFYHDDDYENEVFKMDEPFAYPIECLHMETLEGDYVYTSQGSKDVCAMYIIGEPDTLVQIEVLSMNAQCQDDAIISFVDGWELQGEYFPSDEDHVLSPSERFAEKCGGKIQKKFLAHQNAAVLQFVLPKQGQGFTIRVTFKQTHQPCNVISMFPSGVYTLRNYGRRVNCSVAVIYPANAKVLNIDVGQTMKKGSNRITETGPKTECGDKDHVQVLDGSGLSTSLMRNVIPPLCGLSSLSIAGNMTLGCQNSVVRLVSSGIYYNSVTVDFERIPDDQVAECVEKK